MFDLLADRYVETPDGVPVRKETAKQQRAASAFDALVAAGERLTAVIRACRGIPNKELGRFTSQINSLVAKWESWAKKR